VVDYLEAYKDLTFTEDSTHSTFSETPSDRTSIVLDISSNSLGAASRAEVLQKELVQKSIQGF
jgi:hypothetical protein